MAGDCSPHSRRYVTRHKNYGVMLEVKRGVVAYHVQTQRGRERS
jgi:hypothetical protein